MSSFVNKGARLLKHENSIVREDHLDKRWEEATGEVVDEVIFLSKHTAVSNRPALTVHPIGTRILHELFVFKCITYMAHLINQIRHEI